MYCKAPRRNTDITLEEWTDFITGDSDGTVGLSPSVDGLNDMPHQECVHITIIADDSNSFLEAKKLNN